MPVSTCLVRDSAAVTHIDEDVDRDIALLLEDTVGRPDKVSLGRDELIDLLQRQVRLKEAALTEEVERQTEVAQQTDTIGCPELEDL